MSIRHPDDCAHEWTTWRMTQHSDYRGRAMRERHCLRCGAYQTMRVESWLTVPVVTVAALLLASCAAGPLHAVDTCVSGANCYAVLSMADGSTHVVDLGRGNPSVLRRDRPGDDGEVESLVVLSEDRPCGDCCRPHLMMSCALLILDRTPPSPLYGGMRAGDMVTRYDLLRERPATVHEAVSSTTWPRYPEGVEVPLPLRVCVPGPPPRCELPSVPAAGPSAAPSTARSGAPGDVAVQHSAAPVRDTKGGDAPAAHNPCADCEGALSQARWPGDYPVTLPDGTVTRGDAHVQGRVPVALRAAASTPPEVPGWLAGLVEALCDGYRAGTESTARLTTTMRRE